VVVPVDDVRARDLRVEPREAAQRVDGRLDEEGQEKLRQSIFFEIRNIPEAITEILREADSSDDD